MRNTILASRTSDEGCCLICAECGHMFLQPKPLSDESESMDNVTLSKALWAHMCSTGLKVADRRRNNGR